MKRHVLGLLLALFGACVLLGLIVAVEAHQTVEAGRIWDGGRR